MQLKLVPLTIIAGGAAAIATAVTAPQFVGAPLCFIGGALSGASIVEKRNGIKKAQKETASRVSGAFSAIYERNRGLVDPVELGFVSNVTVEQSHAFLESLAESTGGSKLQSKTGVGVCFNFPHANSVLDELSQNAQGWAANQNAQLTNQIENMRQALRATQMAQATMPAPQVRQVNEDVWKQ